MGQRQTLVMSTTDTDHCHCAR